MTIGTHACLCIRECVCEIHMLGTFIWTHKNKLRNIGMREGGRRERTREREMSR